VFKLQLLRPDHESALLDFELENRAYFSQSICDRGDEFFEEFAERHHDLLAVQEAGDGVFYVLVDDDESVVGRFNLYEITEGAAVVGYRVAQRVSGQGVATAALRDLCQIARQDVQLRILRATVSNENVASLRVLKNSGFVAIGPTQIGGREAEVYELALAEL